MDAGKRDEGAAEGSHGAGDAGTRLLSTLLTEMDGLEHATGAVSAFPLSAVMSSFAKHHLQARPT